MRRISRRLHISTIVVAVATMLGWAPAHAELILSKVIIDLRAGDPPYHDLEVWNSGEERIYVVVSPSEIISAGMPDQTRVEHPDPTVSGLLVTPQRIVLEAQQRRLVRVSAVGPRRDKDRVYRVTVKEVAGEVTSETTALKILLGYDVLVIYRPPAVSGQITGTRDGRKLTLHNDSNTAQEIFDGKQCDTKGANCASLMATRLYPDANLEQELMFDTPVEYSVTYGDRVMKKQF